MHSLIKNLYAHLLNLKIIHSFWMPTFSISKHEKGRFCIINQTDSYIDPPLSIDKKYKPHLSCFLFVELESLKMHISISSQIHPWPLIDIIYTVDINSLSVIKKKVFLINANHRVISKIETDIKRRACPISAFTTAKGVLYEYDLDIKNKDNAFVSSQISLIIKKLIKLTPSLQGESAGQSAPQQYRVGDENPSRPVQVKRRKN